MKPVNRPCLWTLSLLITAAASAQTPPTVAPAAPGAGRRLPAAPAAPPSVERTAPAPATQPGTAAGQPEHLNFYLTDGSILSGKLEVTDIPIDTQFGSLRVPVNQIVSFTPGLDSHPQLAQQINDLIQRLSAPEAGEREKAQAVLRARGASVRQELLRHHNDADPERKLRITALLEEMAEEDEEDPKAAQPALTRLDQVQTPDFTIAGRIVPQTFRILSPYGPLTVSLSNIRHVARPVVHEKTTTMRTVAVEGTNLAPMNFKETGIRVQRGDKVQLRADGTVAMTPWGGNNMSTPDGSPNLGWYMSGGPNQIAVGTLIGRIGKSGEVIRIGARHSFTAQQSGVLQLGVAMRPEYANNQFPGKYNVKVRVEPK